MKKRNVVAFSSLPTKPMGLPWSTATLWLVMDRFDAPSWAHGVVWTVWTLMWVILLVGWWHEVQRDVPGFGNDTK
jgi:hypothetical protein